jgi:hypothetical protein
MHLPNETIFVPLISADQYEQLKEFDLNIFILDTLAQYTNSGLRDIEQAIKLLKVINLTQKPPLYMILITFLVFCKIRHPNYFTYIANKWPDINDSTGTLMSGYKTKHSDSIFNENIVLSSKKLDREGVERDDQRTVTLHLCSLLAINGTSEHDMNAKYTGHDPSMTGIMKLHFMSLHKSPSNPKSSPIFDVSNYLQILDQVGRLV